MLVEADMMSCSQISTVCVICTWSDDVISRWLSRERVCFNVVCCRIFHILLLLLLLLLRRLVLNCVPWWLEPRTFCWYNSANIMLLSFHSFLMPNTHRRRDETVESRRRRRCEHKFATSSRLLTDSVDKLKTNIVVWLREFLSILITFSTMTSLCRHLAPSHQHQ